MKYTVYDIDAIRDLVSMEDVVSQFGIETKSIGRKVSVLCPFHSDEHFGSAFIEDDRKIKCYVCGRSFSIFDVYMQMCNLSFSEALEQVVKDYHLEYLKKEDHSAGKDNGRSQIKKAPTITNDEWAIIGLYQDPSHERKEFFPFSVSYEQQKVEKGFCLKEDEAYILCMKGKSRKKHLLDLCQEEPETFCWMALEKCRETYEKYKQLYSFFYGLWVNTFDKNIELMLLSIIEGCIVLKNVFNKINDFSASVDKG